MKIIPNSNLLGLNPMMEMLENGNALNGHGAEKKNHTFTSLNGNEFPNLNDYQTTSITQSNTNTLFSNLDEMNGNPSTKQFSSYSSSLMMNGKDQNNNFFHFEQTDHMGNNNNGNNNNLIDYNYFNRFNSFMEINTNEGN